MTQSRREALRRQQEAQARAKRLQRIILVAAIVLGLVVIGVVGTIVVSQLNKGGTAAGTNSSVPVNATSDASGIVVNPGTFKDGVPKVEVFLDYQCPVCKQFETQFGTTLDDMATKGEIQLIYRTMTFLDNNLRNDSSLKAGIAAACADNAGAYSAYHNAIFAGQPTNEGTGYTTQQLRVDFAGTAGITGDKLTGFQQCYDSRTTQSFVEGTNEKAAADGVNSTPTIMVNGTKLDNNTIFTQGADAFRQTVLTTKGNG
ncbi:MAG: thioredoxin domain-containing protein [Micropruina glycogenica]|nr:thioredoxin domain-containing protein [Propionibacteriaceae bacterium]